MDTENIKILIGLKIKNYRKHNNYTQEQLCDILDIDVSTLSKIENGKNFPSFETISNMIYELKINPCEFFCVKETETFDLKQQLILEEVKGLSKKDQKKVLDFIQLIKY